MSIVNPSSSLRQVTQLTGVNVSEIAPSAGKTSTETEIIPVTLNGGSIENEATQRKLMKPVIQRPGFVTHEKTFSLHGQEVKPGLYWHGWGKAKGNSDPEPIDIWVSTPIYAIAQSQDQHGSNHGLLLRFCDSSGRWKEWAAPLHLLKGNGDELRGELLSNGLRYSLSNPRLLLEWMMSEYPNDRIVAATCTGWTSDASTFVLPNQTIGQSEVRFQSDQPGHDVYTECGNLDRWREGVARQCVGNPILILSLSVAFAGPLLLKAKQQHTGGAGIHLMGDSSKGKTTALQVASSVWGGPEFVGSWKSTGNGLEAIATARNDTLLPLDEISESNSKEIGSIVYALANGHGKQRAARNGTARRSARWRLMTLSSGERSLSAHMGESGKEVKAGQEARLLDVPATNRKFGAFDNLHGSLDGSAFANTLKHATSQNYGVAGPTFIRHLIADTDDLPDLYASTCKLPGFRGSSGIEPRAAGIFALVAMAGEKATEYGLTGWEPGDAICAAMEAFEEWRDFRGQGNTETHQILHGIRDFLAKHGDSRFSELNPVGENHRHTVRDRAGYWKDEPQGRVYLFNPPALKEAGKGHDTRRILDALDTAGWITEHAPSKRSKSYKTAGTVCCLYAVRPRETES